MNDDAERNLISRLIYHKELPQIVAAGINLRHFHDQEQSVVWDWIVAHWEKYGSVPDRETLRAQFGPYKLSKVPEALEYYIEQVRDSHRKEEALLMMGEAADFINKGEVQRALSTLADSIFVVEQETSVTDDTEVLESWEERLAYYGDTSAQRGDLLGISTGFSTFDQITAGFQPEHFVVLIGPAKAGKSSILLRSVKAAVDVGKRVLFIGFEMSNREQGARWDGLASGVNYTHLLHGNMTPREKAVVETAGRAGAKKEGSVVFVHDVTSATLTGLLAKVHQYKPDILFVDGLYMMDSEIEGVESMDTRSLTKISRGLKRIAQIQKIPVVATTQALDHKWKVREGLTSSAAGYSSAFAQDCDFMLGIEPVNEEQVAVMRLLIGRSSMKSVILVDFDWEHGRIEEKTEFRWSETEYDDG